MKATARFLFLWVFMAALSLAVTSCNKDEELTAGERPEIEFDHADGIYRVNVGEELTLAPDVKHGEGAEYLWTLDDGTVVCRERVWASRWDKTGEYYAMLTVRNAAGTDREEVRIDVIAPLPPAISLALPPQGLTILKDTDYRFDPLFGNVADGETLTVAWFVNGVKAGDGETFTFRSDRTGVYDIKVKATNSAGSSEKEISVTVVDVLPVTLRFVPLSYYYKENERYTTVGRPVAVIACGENVPDGEYEWTVDGLSAANHGPIFIFTPHAAGCHSVTVSARGVTVSMTVNVVQTVARRGGSGDGAAVMEYCPAPGQFIGESSSVGGMTDDITTSQAAVDWASARFEARKFVSLGAWGGYLTARFDRSVEKKASGYDFAVMSNAITSSNEPGIVWVMQDVNGNGLPDDEWYELRGSDFSGIGVSHAYAATYYRPAGDCMPVQWTDATGGCGTIDYLGATHKQPCYYPKWIDQEAYTLYGACLPPRNSLDAVTGMWSNNPFEWGYADNLGSDLIDGDTYSGSGVWTGFRIANAVTPDGSPVSLDFVDFVKIQTGVMTKSGRLGELSTEVCGIRIM